MVSLQRSYALHCKFDSGLFCVPFTLQDNKSPGCPTQQRPTNILKTTSWPDTFSKTDWRPCRYPWMTSRLTCWRPNTSISCRLFCSKHLNNAFRFFWKAMGLAYANPPLSLLAKGLTQIANERARAVLCTPDWGYSGEHTYQCQLLYRTTAGRVQLPDGPIYLPEDADTTMQALQLTSFLSMFDGSLNHVPLCALDQVLLKQIRAQNRGLTLLDLKTRSPEHTSATPTECEYYDDELLPAIAREDTPDQLSEIASSIPPVDSSCGDLQHGAFLAQEVDVELISEQRSPVGKPVLQMQHTCSGESAAENSGALAGPASNSMPLSEHDSQELRKMLHLRPKGIERKERL